jgi:hypothetical protein
MTPFKELAWSSWTYAVHEPGCSFEKPIKGRLRVSCGQKSCQSTIFFEQRCFRTSLRSGEAASWLDMLF